MKSKRSLALDQAAMRARRGRPRQHGGGRKSPVLAEYLARLAGELEDERAYNAFHAVRTTGALWTRESFYLRPPGFGWPVAFDIVDSV